jgi:hypothetical protein
MAAWAETHPSVADPDEPTRDYSGLAAVLAAQEVSIALEARYRDLPADARPRAGRVCAPLLMGSAAARSRGSLSVGPGTGRSTSGAAKSSRSSAQRRRGRPVIAGKPRRRIAVVALLLALGLAALLPLNRRPESGPDAASALARSAGRPVRAE